MGCLLYVLGSGAYPLPSILSFSVHLALAAILPRPTYFWPKSDRMYVPVFLAIAYVNMDSGTDMDRYETVIPADPKLTYRPKQIQELGCSQCTMNSNDFYFLVFCLIFPPSLILEAFVMSYPLGFPLYARTSS